MEKPDITLSYDVEDLVTQKPHLRIAGRNIHHDLADQMKSIYTHFIELLPKMDSSKITDVFKLDEIYIIVFGGKIVLMNLESYTPGNFIIGKVPIPKKIDIWGKDKEKVSYIKSLLETYIEETL